MEFSVIVPVVHGGRFLEETLGSLRALDYPADEFEVLPAEGASRGAALNAACRRARGRVLVFTDDDCIVPRDWLRVLRAALARDRNVGVIGGRDELAPAGSAFDRAMDFVLNSFLGTGNLRHGDRRGAGRYYPKLWCMAVPREAAAAVEDGQGLLFDEKLPLGEDMDLAARVERAGSRIAYAPEWVVAHHRETTWGSFARRSFLSGRVSRALGLQALPHALLSVLAVALFWPPSLLAYLAVLAAEGVRALIVTGSAAAAALVPGLLATCHVARALGWLSGRFRGRISPWLSRTGSPS